MPNPDNQQPDWRLWVIGALWALTTMLVSYDRAAFRADLDELKARGSPAIRERLVAVESDIRTIRIDLAELLAEFKEHRQESRAGHYNGYGGDSYQQESFKVRPPITGTRK